MLFCLQHAWCPALLIVSSCRSFAFNVSCKPLISSCLFNGIAAMQSYPLPLALPSCVHAHKHIHTSMHSPHPTLPCSYTPSQAKHIKCASVVAAGLMNNAQKQKTRPSFYYLILCGGRRGREGGKERQRGKESKAKRKRHRGVSQRLVYALLRFIHTAMWETGAGFYAWINTHNGVGAC